MSDSRQTRLELVRLLQLAYSGEKAAALAYQGHARSVRDPEVIEKIEKDEWVHREIVGRLLAELGAAPLRFREIRSGAVGHTLSFFCGLAGWFLPMYFAAKLETKNVQEYERAAEYAAELGLDHFLAPLREMAEVEILHEKYFFEVIGRAVPPKRDKEGLGGHLR